MRKGYRVVKILLYILVFFLTMFFVGIIYCCIAVNRNKDREIFDDKWIGSLTLTEHYNQPSRSELFYCENHYEHANARMTLVICHQRPPSAEESPWDGVPREIERAQVIELEGRYFWRELGLQ